ncbi:MAG: C25 family cysteine peptidase [Ardenticatenaceae bacterium]
MRKLPKLLIMCLFLLCLLVAPLSAAYRAQRSVPSSSISATSVHLNLISDSLTVRESAGKDGRLNTFETSLPRTGEPGERALPMVRRMVGVPSRSTPEVTIQLADPQLLPAFTYRLEQMPSHEPTGALSREVGGMGLSSEGVEPRDVPDERFYGQDEQSGLKEQWYPTDQLTIGEPITLRGQVVVEVIFTPLQVNLATGEARWYPSADVTLEWASDKLMPNMREVEDPIYEPFLEATLSNYEEARAWRVEGSDTSSGSGESGGTESAGQQSWMIQLQGKGLFGIPFADLQAQGVDTSNAERIAVYYGSGDQQQEQAIWIENDSLYLINTRDHSRWSKNLGYRLEILPDGQTGKRMAELSSSPDQSTTVDSVPYELHVEQDTIYDSRYSIAGANDRWYWEQLSVLRFVPTDVVSHAFDLPGVLSSHSAQAAQVTLELVPPENGNHYVKAALNGQQVGEKGADGSWSDQSAFDQVMDVRHATLMPTANHLELTQEWQSGGVDILLFNSFTVRYQRSLSTQLGGLLFDSDRSSGVNFKFEEARAEPTQPTQLFLPMVMSSASNTRSVAASPNRAPAVSQMSRDGRGFSFLAFEVSTQGEPQRISGGTTDGSTFTFGRVHPENEQYLVAQHDQALSVAAITPYTNTEHDSNIQADYLIITPPEFKQALEPLVSHRTNQCGPNREACTVRLVTTTQIYNEFGSGVMEPNAIRGFLEFAYQNWSAPKPAYLLLVGDATHDPFDLANSGKKVWLPPWLIEKDLHLGEVPGDHGYVVALEERESPNSHLEADMYVGRLPANSATEAANMVAKIVDYETTAPTGEWRRRVLLTTDDAPDPAGDFYSLSDHLVFPDTIQLTKAYLRQPGTPYTNDEIVRDKIAEEMNKGQVIVQYIGHSSRTQWGDSPGIWSLSRGGESNDLDFLSANERLPFSLPWTCLEGLFTTVESESMSEEMLRLPDRGIIASFAPTGLDVAQGHDQITKELYRLLFDPTTPQTQLGPLTTLSKKPLISSQYERMIYTYMLFGDPAMHLNIDLQ